MSDQITAIVRTWAAIAGGWVASLLIVDLGLDVDGPTVAAAITSVIIGVWYAAIRLASTRLPWLERLLVIPTPPKYDD